MGVTRANARAYSRKRGQCSARDFRMSKINHASLVTIVVGITANEAAVISVANMHESSVCSARLHLAWALRS